MGINFERKPPFCNNITYTTKIKTLLSYSEDYQDIKIPSSHLLLFYILQAQKNKYYTQAYMEEHKYERIEEVSYFDSDSDSDSDSDFEE